MGAVGAVSAPAAPAGPAAALTPAPAKSWSPSVEAEVVLAMSASEFTSRRAGNTSKVLFQNALAIAAGVNPLDIVVGDISASGSDTKIVSGIKADDPQQVLTSLTLDSLNRALAAQGLPEAKSMKKRIVTPESGISNGAIVAIVLGVIAVLIALAYFVMKPGTTPEKLPPQQPSATQSSMVQDQLVYGQPLKSDPITPSQWPAPAFLPR